ncbi:copper amine oxidase N-terminal domain-containing protein [Ammoniphilus resinae]|uniref:Copper amine oxidase-like N-terminal domain-containing protein n=1 Tax=Ammoniphilus resinae TaxID=861532 RepID=A0ABS4GJ60_9BACL|nr:copper amine oxidase N-terminal domain-containing protein [Ammoniphilus resinae]MBP1930127.1 hypothetical protein [Ammoniphilus resinae]
MLRLSKIASVLTTAALLAYLAAPIPANAATMFSVIGVQTVDASASGTDYKDLGDVKVKVAIADLDQQDFFFLRLPTDFKINIPAATSSNIDIAGAVVTKPDGTTEPLIQVVGGSSDPWNDGAANHVSVYLTNSNELKIVVKNPSKAATVNADADTMLKISLGSVFVPGNTDSTIQAVIEGKIGSTFKDETITVANKGVGLVSVSVDSGVTIPVSGSGTLKTIRFKEDIPGAFKSGSESIKLVLPYGFEWTKDQYSINFVDGDSGAVGQMKAIPSNDRRELIIEVPNATKTASYFTINQAEIQAVDSTTAHFGEISVEVSGPSSTDTSSFVVGNYTDYNTTVSADQANIILSGHSGAQDTNHTEIGQLVIEENAPGSMRAGGTIRIELTGGVKWAVDEQGQLVGPPQIAANLSNLQGLELDQTIGKSGWELVGSSGNAIKATIKNVSNGTKGAKLVLEKGLVDIPADTTPTDVHAILSGTADVSGDAGVVAQVLPPISLGLDGSFLKPVQGGVQDQTISDIVVKESVAGAISTTGEEPAIRFTFDSGVKPTSIDPSQIAVDGDLVLASSDATIDKDSSGHWYIQIPVKSASTTPSAITLKGLKVTVDRTVPEGELLVKVNGSMIQTDETDVAGSIAVAKVVIPKNGNIMNSAVFVIGSKSYTVNGQEKTSDAAPFIDQNGRTQLPVRAAAEAFGAIVGWDPEDQIVSILKDGKAISVPVGGWVMNVGGVFLQMDSPAVMKDGRVYLPLRVLSEALGATVNWDAENQTVYLN